MYIKTKLAAITTTIALASVISGPTHAALETDTKPVSLNTESTPIAAVDTAKIDFTKPEVTTTPAPEPEPVPEPVIVPEEAPEPVVAPVVPAPVAPKVVTPPPAPVVPAPAPVQAAAPVQTPAPQIVAASGKGQTVLAAAYAQIGRTQDCTMLVTNALKSVGINFHDWPIGYFSLGTQVSAADAQPGDLLYYANGGSGLAHIAVYAGNGMAVHGGYNGNQTVEFKANVGSGPVYIRLR